MVECYANCVNKYKIIKELEKVSSKVIKMNWISKNGMKELTITYIKIHKRVIKSYLN